MIAAGTYTIGCSYAYILLIIGGYSILGYYKGIGFTFDNELLFERLVCYRLKFSVTGGGETELVLLVIIY